MKEKINFDLRFKRRRRFLAIIVWVVVAVVWVGWVSGTTTLMSIIAGFPPMSPLAALAAALLALIIFQPPFLSRGIYTASAIGVAIGSFILVAVALLPAFHFDLVMKYVVDGPLGSQNAFAPFTPLCFLLLAGVSLFRRAHRWPVGRQAVIIAVIFALYFIVIGHITSSVYVQTFAFFSNVSIPAEITILLLAVGFLFSEDEIGVMRLLRSATEGGMIARSLLVLVFLTPAMTTLFFRVGVMYGLYANSLSTAMNVAVNVLLFVIVVWLIGNRLRISEEAKLRSEQQLVEHQHVLETFQQATDASTEGVVMTDKNANIIYVNAAWERMNGWTMAEVVGKNPRILASGKTNRQVYKAMWRALVHGKPFTTEAIINKRKDGREFTAALQLYPVQGSAGQVMYVAIEQDISERKAVEQAKTEFVTIATHQLATPLTSMRWLLEMLHSTKPFQPQQEHYLTTIMQTNLRMIQLVNALLNSSRIDVGSFMIIPKPMPLADEVRSVVTEVQPDIEQKRLRVTVDVTGVKKPYSADRVLFRIIVQNFLTNAIRYTPPEGLIGVRLAVRANQLVLEVSDSGCGIPPAEEKDIFKKMFRASNAVRTVPDGSGLGLYMVKAIVGRSGGTVSFTSKLNVGTTFTARWPMKGWIGRRGNRELSYQSENEYTATV